MSTPGGRFGLVIVVYGAPVHAVELARRARDVGWTPVLVENGTELAADADVDIVRVGANLGYGAGANAGIAHLRRTDPGIDHIAVSNDDLVAGSGGFEWLGSTAADDQMLFCTIQRAGDGAEDCLRPGVRAGLWKALVGLQRAATRYPGETVPSGALVFGSVAAWLELDGFDPEYFLYFEDVDLHDRAETDPVVNSRSVVVDLEHFHHVGDRSTRGDRVVAGLAAREYGRSLVAYCRRSAPQWRLALAAECLALALGGLRSVVRGRAVAGRRNRLALVGVVDALRRPADDTPFLGLGAADRRQRADTRPLIDSHAMVDRTQLTPR